MTAVQYAIEDYVLGNGRQEQERLKLQAGFLEKWTEQFLLLAGVEPGMRVLDLGCGLGHVSLLAAKLVGLSGHVTGIDRDLVVIEKARELGAIKSQVRSSTLFTRKYSIFMQIKASMQLSGGTSCSFSQNRLMQSFMRQNKFGQTALFCFMKQILVTESEATRTGHFSKERMRLLPKLPGVAGYG